MIDNKVTLSTEWWVYIIQASDNSYYTGITTDLNRRFEQHKNKTGAKYFYGRDPIAIVFKESHGSRSSASRQEAYIKSLSRRQKEALIMDKSIGL
jgi:putative endonuclease